MTSFWLNDPTVLFSDLEDFFPTKSMSLNERLNSIVRLSLYVSVILFLVKKHVWPVYILLSTLIITLVLHQFNFEPMEPLKANEVYDRDGFKCTVPTVNNPFMNVTIDEITDNPKRARACDPTDTYIANQIKDKSSYNLYLDADKIFSKETDLRFWTTPVTTIPNDTRKFARWLFGGYPSCKEDSRNCRPFNNLKQQRSEYVDPMTGAIINPVGN